MDKLVRRVLSRISFGKNISSRNYHKWYYNSQVWKTTTFLGVETMKSVSDMWNYQEIIFSLRPSLIIEFGTNCGGAALFFSLLLKDINPDGKVLTVEIDPSIVNPAIKKYSNIELIIDSSTSEAIKTRIKSLIEEYPGPIFAILDSDHRKKHVFAEMELLRKFLKKGDYLIVEDSNINGHPVFAGRGEGPYEAIKAYFKKYPGDYKRDIKREKKFGFTFSPRGFLIKN